MPQLSRTRSGLWTSRKVIPADVRSAYGKSEEKPTWPASLSRTEAVAEFTSWLAGVESRIDLLRKQSSQDPVRLSDRQIRALAGKWYRERLSVLEENPPPASGWEFLKMELAPKDQNDRLNWEHLGERYDGPWQRVRLIEQEELPWLLQREGLKLEDATRGKLLDRMHTLAFSLANVMIGVFEGSCNAISGGGSGPSPPSAARIMRRRSANRCRSGASASIHPSCGPVSPFF